MTITMEKNKAVTRERESWGQSCKFKQGSYLKKVPFEWRTEGGDRVSHADLG